MTKIEHTFLGMLVASTDGIHENIHVRSTDGQLDVTLRDEQADHFKSTKLFKNATVSITITYEEENEVNHPFVH